jgi:hypothetical protein
MKTLRLVADKGNINQYDAQVLLAAIYRREKRPKEALPLLNGLIARFPRNYLFRLETVARRRRKRARSIRIPRCSPGCGWDRRMT